MVSNRTEPWPLRLAALVHSERSGFRWLVARWIAGLFGIAVLLSPDPGRNWPIGCAIVSAVAVACVLFPASRCRRSPAMERPGSVRWFGLSLYLDAFYYALLSKWRMRQGDPRAAHAGTEREFDFSHRRGEAWLDFIADSGDSFQAFFAVASRVAAPLIAGEGSHEVELPAASAVVHGGDLFYPWPTKTALRRRFLDVIGCAPAWSEAEHFALPGNHEWVDGLELYHGLLHGGSLPRLRNRTSYFALHLPGCMLFAVDMIEEPGLPDVDEEQLEFFLGLAQKGADPVILVTHIPDYFKRTHLGMHDCGAQLAVLRSRLGDRLRLQISGDVHYYRRYVPDSDNSAGPQLVICGGGGAFSHGTSVPEASTVFCDGRRYRSVVEYPTPAESDSIIAAKMFLVFHPSLMRFCGGIYALMTASVLPTSAGSFTEATANIMEQSTQATLCFPTAVILMFAVHFVFVSGNEKGGLRFTARCLALATGHTLVHVGVCLILRVLLELAFATPYFGIMPYCLVMQALMCGLGGFAGHLITAAYFFSCYFLFRIHWNEAWAFIMHQGHKSWLRIRIDEGGVDVYALGIDNAQEPDGRGCCLDGGSPTRNRLIDHVRLVF